LPDRQRLLRALRAIRALTDDPAIVALIDAVLDADDEPSVIPHVAPAPVLSVSRKAVNQRRYRQRLRERLRQWQRQDEALAHLVAITTGEAPESAPAAPCEACRAKAATQPRAGLR